MGDVRRTRGCGVDRESEHRAGRQQEALPDVRRDNADDQADEHDVRSHYDYGELIDFIIAYGAYSQVYLNLNI